MNNRVTQTYFEPNRFAPRVKEIQKSVGEETGFMPETELFKGKVYDDDKIGSLLQKGTYRGKSAVLKIQGLKPDMEETEIIRRFNAQNKSLRIHVPEVLLNSPWQEKRGYGYFIMEWMEGTPMVSNPLTSPGEQNDFLTFYNEYRTKSLHTPFFDADPTERNALVFVTRRVMHWVNIAEAQKTLTPHKVKRVEQFLGLAAKKLPDHPMEFVHGHLGKNDILKTKKGYGLLGNLFWSYRPEYYDATFHLWAGIKELRNTTIQPLKIIDYLEQWREAYQKQSCLKNASHFNEKFSIMMLERCMGAILVDLENQEYEKNKPLELKHLYLIFETVFNHFKIKLTG